MTITCYLAKVIVDDKINNDEQMHLVRHPFQWTQRCAGAIQTALPNAACPRLLQKPLDAGIWQLLAPYCPSGRQGSNQQNNNNNTPTLLATCSGTIPRTLLDRGGSGLQQKPLVATIGQVLRPIVGIETTKHQFLPSFFIVTHYKEIKVTQGP